MLRTALYSRKSLEDDDRQVQSIESQQNELRPIAAKRNLSVLEVFGEAQSAKAPGRPKFNQMMAMVNRGEIDTILCWKLDRLARNPIDGAAMPYGKSGRNLIQMTTLLGGLRSRQKKMRLPSGSGTQSGGIAGAGNGFEDYRQISMP